MRELDIKAVLLDMDGTLLDTALDFDTAINRLLIQENRSRLSMAQVRAEVTNGSVGIIQSIFAIQSGTDEFKRLRQDLLSFYKQCLTDKTRCFRGLDDALKLVSAKRIPWGIVTNKPVEYAQPIVDSLTPDCSVLVCPDHVAVPKPDPEGLLLAAKQLGIQPSNCIYVGDHIRDIEAANAAQMFSVAAGWGYLEQNSNINNWGASIVFDTSKEFADWLTKTTMELTHSE